MSKAETFRRLTCTEQLRGDLRVKSVRAAAFTWAAGLLAVTKRIQVFATDLDEETLVVRVHRALLEKQKYPDLRMYPGGPPKKPYDVTTHTLPLLMGVDVRTLTRPAPPPRVVTASSERPGVLPAADSDSWASVNRIWKLGGAVWRDTVSGDFSTSSLGPAWKPVKRPRIGLYKSFIPTMDEGWTRWLLEQFGFEYSSVSNKDILSGGLRERFDTLVFPDQPASQIRSGWPAWRSACSRSRCGSCTAAKCRLRRPSRCRRWPNDPARPRSPRH
jgi:hypothetical protein